MSLTQNPTRRADPLEIVARDMCLAAGIDPDSRVAKPGSPRGMPAWCNFRVRQAADGGMVARAWRDAVWGRRRRKPDGLTAAAGSAGAPRRLDEGVAYFEAVRGGDGRGSGVRPVEGLSGELDDPAPKSPMITIDGRWNRRFSLRRRTLRQSVLRGSQCHVIQKAESAPLT